MVMSLGALCFGIVTGYITYRTLVRKDTSSVSDLAAVIAALGGGVVTQVFDPADGNLFGWYAIGLLVGMVVFLILRLSYERPKKPGDPISQVLGDQSESPQTARSTLLGD